MKDLSLEIALLIERLEALMDSVHGMGNRKADQAYGAMLAAKLSLSFAVDTIAFLKDEDDAKGG